MFSPICYISRPIVSWKFIIYFFTDVCICFFKGSDSAI